MYTLTQNIRWAFRRMAKNPTLTFVIVLSLGLAIGANTAIFSVVDAVFLRDIAIEDMDNLIRLRESHSEDGQEDLRSLTPAIYFQWTKHNDVFSSIGASTSREFNLTGEDDAERIRGAAITATLFPTIGVEPILGRNFLPEEDIQGSDSSVVILNYDLWQRRFNGDENVLGKQVNLNGVSHTVVGVMPQRFFYPYDANMWVPLALADDPSLPQRWYLNTPARLKPGVSVEQARIAMTSLVENLAVEEPLANGPVGVDLWPMRNELTRDLNRTLALLFAAAAFVLLIACVNVSNLLLAQSLGQRTESVVRSALGANRWHLIRQAFVQSVLLGLMGGALGLLLTFWSIKPLGELNPLAAIRQFDVEPRIDLSSFLFTLGLSVGIGLLFGLLPAMRIAGHRNLQSLLSEGSKSSSQTSGGNRLFGGLVVVEIALTVIVLIGAGVIIQTYYQLNGAERGFSQDDTVTAMVAFSNTNYPEFSERTAYLERVTERLEALPGVASAGAVTTLPLYVGHRYATYSVEGRPATNSAGAHTLHHRLVTPGYFEAMEIPLIKGRKFQIPQDYENHEVVIISESLAELHWPDENPIGKRVKLGSYDSSRPWMTIVGVVGDVMENPGPVLERDDAWYIPYAFGVTGTRSVIMTVRTESANPGSFIPSIREAFREVDRFQPIYNIKTIKEIVRERTQQERFMAFLYGFFGLLSTILAVMGIYAVLSFAVNQRKQEFGVRMAMGADHGTIRTLVLKKAMQLTLMGLGLGLLGALAFNKVLSTHLYGVEPNDPKTFLFIAVGLIIAALASSYLPARRITNLNPVDVLRYE